MATDDPKLEVDLDPSGGLLVHLRGVWVKDQVIPDIRDITNAFQKNHDVQRLSFDSEEIARWDSVLLTFLVKLCRVCNEKGIECDTRGLPDGVLKLIHLAFAVAEAKQIPHESRNRTALYRIGERLLANRANAQKQLYFLGETCLSLSRFFTGRARYRSSDIWLFIEECGPRALPIVTLISVLVGLILAFVGSVQLTMFGAQIYIANLVGLGMAREMGALMTAVIMAGRTGAAFAAQLGSMKVNEEIDALKTMGISPVDFLVLPRIIALVLMMPLLCLYADFMGILGGMLVGVGLLDLSLTEYYTQTEAALAMRDFNVGLFKSAVYGILVAIAGCMRGMDSGRSSAAVGEAATNAVVTGIIWIIVSDAILTVIYNAFGV
ncbi:MAG: ABC transporter permease [Methylococcaceae bacterium]|nr:ABC transporter permease [Methylococcaceae bacterium]